MSVPPVFLPGPGEQAVIALLDGTLADPCAPLLRADDLGLLRGEGVFETVLAVAGQPRELDAHLDRMARSAATLELAVPRPALWCRAVAAAVAALTVPEVMLRLVLTRGPDVPGAAPTAFVRGVPVPEQARRQRRDGVRAVTLQRGVDPDLAAGAPWLLLDAKTLSYAVNMAAHREAVRRGVEDAVFVSPDGRVLEGAMATVVVAGPGRCLRTPSPPGILAGTTQAALFRAAEAAGWRTEVAVLRVADLLAADGVWLTSAVRLAAPVRELDGKPLPVPVDLGAEVLDLLAAPD